MRISTNRKYPKRQREKIAPEAPTTTSMVASAKLRQISSSSTSSSRNRISIIRHLHHLQRRRGTSAEDTPAHEITAVLRHWVPILILAKLLITSFKFSHCYRFMQELELSQNFDLNKTFLNRWDNFFEFQGWAF